MNIICLDGGELRDQVMQVLASLDTGGDIAFQTSGSTGSPRNFLLHSADILTRKKGVGDGGARWLLCYSPVRWAGISIITHCWQNKCILVVPRTLGIDHLVQAAITHSVTHVSLTPSLLKKMILTVRPNILSTLQLEQITFGGEWTSQNDIDQVNNIWPTCRVTHTYALTEFGDVCSVSDRKAGFPKEKFDRFSLTKDGELIIDCCPTGDMWTLRGDRYMFVGRREEIVNVGGNKVSPVEIEDLLMQSGMVTNVRVYGIPNPIMGQVVALDYVGEIGSGEIHTFLQDKLPKYARPLRIHMVSEIEMTQAGKTRRVI